MIEVGDIVQAIHDGGQTNMGPADVPRKGKTYRVMAVYPQCYGLGVKLRGMNSFPFDGYFLYVDAMCAAHCFDGHRPDGWYFKKVEAADTEFTEQMRKVKEKVDV